MTQLIDSGSPDTDHYRPTRRRWVPTAILVLAVLFVVGILLA